MSRTRFFRPLGRHSFPRVSGDEPGQTLDITTAAGFPRVSGDEPASCDGADARVAFSPRERG